MLKVIRKSISLANAPSLTEDEYGRRSKDWTELLFGIVPEERLMEVFMKAARDHASAFPVSAYELKIAWENLSTEERQTHSAIRSRDEIENPVKYCRARSGHTDEDGNIEVLLGGPGGKTVLVPCDVCRTSAHQQRYAELLDAYRGEVGESKPVEKVVFAMFDQVDRRRFRFMTAVEIVEDANDRLGKAIIDAKDDVERGKMQIAWQRMVRIKEYVRQKS